MVNFQDPAVVLQYVGALAFGIRNWSLKNNEPISTGILEKFWHTINGLYMWVCISLSTSRWFNHPSSWEFFTTLDYELDILRGRRPYRWTIWVRIRGRLMALVTHAPEFPLRQIYSFTRVATLVAVILNFVALDTTTPIDCQVGGVSQVASSLPHSDWSRSPGLASIRTCKSHMLCSSLQGSEQLESSLLSRSSATWALPPLHS